MVSASGRQRDDIARLGRRESLDAGTFEGRRQLLDLERFFEQHHPRRKRFDEGASVGIPGHDHDRHVRMIAACCMGNFRPRCAWHCVIDEKKVDRSVTSRPRNQLQPQASVRSRHGTMAERFQLPDHDLAHVLLIVDDQHC